MSEARQASAIARPLPLVGDGKPKATPHIVNEPRNVTVDVFRALATIASAPGVLGAR
jgi:hypothetical protein